MASPQRLIELITAALYPIKAYNLERALIGLGTQPDPSLSPSASKRIYIEAAIDSLSKEELESLARKVIERYEGADGQAEEVEELRKEVDSHTARSPKNVIFASKSKPVIGLIDVLDVEIDVMDASGDHLVYNLPIEIEGLTWNELVNWYGKMEGLSDINEAADKLKLRLAAAISSPPEKRFFEEYWEFTIGQDKFDAPALLPQVALRHDPKSARERGGKSAYQYQRMDFMILGPSSKRIIVEIDGKQHYTDASGQGSPKLYAEMVSADRDLKFRGYDVYRFGGIELYDLAESRKIVVEFAERLFQALGITFSEVIF